MCFCEQIIQNYIAPIPKMISAFQTAFCFKELQVNRLAFTMVNRLAQNIFYSTVYIFLPFVTFNRHYSMLNLGKAKYFRELVLLAHLSRRLLGELIVN